MSPEEQLEERILTRRARVLEGSERLRDRLTDLEYYMRLNDPQEASNTMVTINSYFHALHERWIRLQEAEGILTELRNKS